MSHVGWLGVAILVALIVVSEVRCHHKEKRMKHGKASKIAHLLALLMLLPLAAKAQSLLSIPGLADTVAKYAKEGKAVGLVDLNAKVSAGAFLPVRTLKDVENIEYVSFGPGAAIKKDEHLRGGVMLSLNLSAIIRKLEGKSAWYKSHVSTLVLPDIRVGPYFFPVLDSEFRWDRSREYVGGALSIGL